MYPVIPLFIPLFLPHKFSDNRIVDPALFLGRDKLLKTKVYAAYSCPDLPLKYWLCNMAHTIWAILDGIDQTALI